MVTAPADRRFLRAQIRPGRRHSPWRARLRVLKTGAGILIAAVAVWHAARFVHRSEGLQVTHIVVSGNQRLSNGEILALVDGLRGRHLLAVNLAEWRQRVLACPWVADATLRRSLPSTIEVQIAERYPMAIGRIGEELYLVDGHGAVIDDYGPRYADLDLPILDGLGAIPGADPETDERRATLASRLLSAVQAKPDVAKRISQLDVSDPHNAVVIVDRDTARIRVGEDHFLERLESYLGLAPTLRQSVPEIDYVDLRFGERVYVGPQAPAPSAPVAKRPGVTGDH